MPSSYIPLRWESTGDQWWYAIPIDWAAANGQCDLVKELIAIDPNLLIKLTSLRRIHRLETLWDDDNKADRTHMAQCRARVARTLLMDCEPRNLPGQQNSLIRAGYGGWLLYTAASAGEVGFANDLIQRDPLVIFGEGEYGINDFLYGAARSRKSGIFRVLLDFVFEMMRRYNNNNNNGGDLEEVFVREMRNRAVHAAARGGNLEVLKELLWDCSDVLCYRDAQGSTILHSASGKGHVEVVNYLITTYDIISSTDDEGNTALHVAAFRGYSSVVEVLAMASPSLTTSRNNEGNTFLHMAVAGLHSPSFHQVDKQTELLRQLVSGMIIDLKDIINIRNKKGKTTLHLAVAGDISSNIVELLMTVHSVDLNVRDDDGSIPLDILKRQTKTSTYNCQGIGISPGTCFRLSDTELFSYIGNDNDSEVSCEPQSSRLSSWSSEPSSPLEPSAGSRRLKFLLKWPRKKDKEDEITGVEIFRVCKDVNDTVTPLRQRHSRFNKSEVAVPLSREFPSPSTKERFTASLMHGVIRATANSAARDSPSSPVSRSFSGPLRVERSQVSDKHRRQSSFSKSLMNQYFCFGAQGLAVENSVGYRRTNRSCRRLVF